MDIGCDMGLSLEWEFETFREESGGILNLKVDISNSLFFDAAQVLIDDVDFQIDNILDLTGASADFDWELKL